MSVSYDSDSEVLSLGPGADVPLVKIREFAAAGKGVHDVIRAIALYLHATLAEETIDALFAVLEEIRVEERVCGLYRGDV
jgi:hypothetical protein